MRPMGVVVVGELDEHRLEMATSEDKHEIQALTPHSADDALAHSVGAWGAYGALEDLDACCFEDVIEGEGELRVPIADQELDRWGSIEPARGDIAGLLGHPDRGRVGGDASDMHGTRMRVDEHQHIEAAQQYRVNVEEVTRHHGRRLGLQELLPGWS